MSTKRPAKIPIALSEARRQLDHWRSQQPSKRTRLPKEFWQQAVRTNCLTGGVLERSRTIWCISMWFE